MVCCRYTCCPFVHLNDKQIIFLCIMYIIYCSSLNQRDNAQGKKQLPQGSSGQWHSSRIAIGPYNCCCRPVNKVQLEHKLLGFLVPTREEPPFPLVHRLVGDFESHCFVRLAGEQHVLVVLVWRLHLLLVGRHEAVAGLAALLRLGVIHLEHYRPLTGVQITRLGHLL